MTDTKDQEMYDLWANNGKCRPRVMASLTVDVTPPCPADLDGDGNVGFADLTRVLNAWGVCSACPEDLDGNGNVGFADLTELLNAWGPC